MDVYQRLTDLKNLLEEKSFFLLGARATGKSHLVQEQLLEDSIVFNLLKSDLYFRLSANPSELGDMIHAENNKNPKKWIIIDEIQKVPALLKEVHRLIDENQMRFLLTGSNTRKLKHNQADLLGGRAWFTRLFPLCWKEIPQFDLDRFLRIGGLPSIYADEKPEEKLNDYIRTYLEEEIQIEGFVRKVPQFSRFLKAAALANGKLLNFAQISSESDVPVSTLKEYYQILRDTLLGFNLEPWVKSKKRKAIATAKFFFFDTGITHCLAGTRALDPNSDLYQSSFEHWIGMELRAYLSYRKKKEELHYWRSLQKQEVNFVLEDHTAIAVTAAQKVSRRDLKGLTAIHEESVFKNLILVSQDPSGSQQGSIRCMHWKAFMEALWSDQLF